MNILIVDDSRTMRMVVRKTLRQTNLGTFNVEEACNGMDAIQKLKSKCRRFLYGLQAGQPRRPRIRPPPPSLRFP